MKPVRKLNRRSFFATVAGGAVAGGALASFVPTASAFQVTDHDPTDPAGHGRGGGTGITDQDYGAHADPSGRGTGRTAPQGTGVTDSDRGAGSDPPGHGRSGVPRPEPHAPEGMSQQQWEERCQNNRATLAELERDAEQPYGWSDQRLDRARTDLGAVQAAAARVMSAWTHGGGGGQAAAEAAYAQQLTLEYGRLQPIFTAYGIGWHSPLTDAAGRIQSMIQLAEQTTARRAEVQRRIAAYRNNLIALGCMSP